MKTKIISYGDDATGFHDKEMPKADLLSASNFKRM